MKHIICIGIRKKFRADIDYNRKESLTFVRSNLCTGNVFFNSTFLTHLTHINKETNASLDCHNLF